MACPLLTDARGHSRTTPEGHLLLLAEQDRCQWDRAEIGEGLRLVRVALRQRPPYRYALMAANAAVHAADRRPVRHPLAQIWPSPVALNRAMAIGQARGP